MTTGTLLSERASVPTRPGRFVDRGSVFAGYVGIGMAVVVVIAFSLIVPVQTLVLLAAPICGLIIGGYANSRSERWRPMRRVFANAVWAGLVTGVSIALMYAAIRLLFVFADAGSMPNATTLTCHMGPDCTYQRYLHDPDLADDLAAAGITDGDSFAAAFLRDQVDVATLIVVLTTGGALIAAGTRSIRKVPEVTSGAEG